MGGLKRVRAGIKREGVDQDLPRWTVDFPPREGVECSGPLVEVDRAPRGSDGEAVMRVVVLRRGEDGYWIAEVPSLPGCISQGKTKAEAITNVKEAIEGWIETMTSHGQTVPDEDFETQVVCV